MQFAIRRIYFSRALIVSQILLLRLKQWCINKINHHRYFDRTIIPKEKWINSLIITIEPNKVKSQTCKYYISLTKLTRWSLRDYSIIETRLTFRWNGTEHRWKKYTPSSRIKSKEVKNDTRSIVLRPLGSRIIAVDTKKVLHGSRYPYLNHLALTIISIRGRKLNRAELILARNSPDCNSRNVRTKARVWERAKKARRFQSLRDSSQNSANYFPFNRECM